MSNSLYDKDFCAWANEQAALPRAGRLSEADVENIAEEIESMGRSEKRELVGRLNVQLLHLLKWQYQPMRNTDRRAVSDAGVETGLATSMFPAACPFTFDQAMSPDFWPE